MTRIATSCLALGLGFLALIGQAGQLPSEPAPPEQAEPAARVAKAPAVLNVASPQDGDLELKQAEIIVELCQIRSPTDGVVKFILKQRGEAVKNLETVIQIQRNDK